MRRISERHRVVCAKMSAAVGVRRSRRLRAYARRVTGLQFSDSEAENAEPREAEERDNHSDAENTDPAEIEQPGERTDMQDGRGVLWGNLADAHSDGTFAKNRHFGAMSVSGFFSADARGAERPCIDLTGEDDDEPPVVDLTSPALERTFRAATFLEPVVVSLAWMSGNCCYERIGFNA